MSIFAIYCGSIYNEFFAIPMNAWGSRWSYQSNKTYAYNTQYSYPYPFGINPVWKGSENELLFYNSFKMKMSVILGVIQMSLGIFMKLANGIFFHHKLDIWYEFLPQILFLLSTFGYLCFLIFAKWTLAVDQSPLILLVLISMFLPSGSGNSNTTLRYIYGDQLQPKIETYLVILALICVPWMLVPKPLWLSIVFNNKKKTTTRKRRS